MLREEKENGKFELDHLNKFSTMLRIRRKSKTTFENNPG
jgi:hypothetical protein